LQARGERELGNVVNGRDIEWHGSVLLNEGAKPMGVRPLCRVNIHRRGFRM
jgi:hypothetical protein